jgi:hypothetical protein
MGLVVLAIVITSLLAVPIVDERCFFMGLGAIIPQVANIPTNLARHLRVHGFDGALWDFSGTLAKLL